MHIKVPAYTLFWRLILVIISASYLIHYYANYSLMEVSSGSMENTLFEGDRIVVDTCYSVIAPLGGRRHHCTPRRGQIIVFQRNKHESMMVKRVVGLSGDRIAVRYGQVFINGKQLSEVYAHHLRNYNANNDSWPLIDRQRAKEVVVPEDSYFVLGDNRELSADSRVLGPISSRMIIGVVAYRLDVVSNLKGWTRSKL